MGELEDRMNSILADPRQMEKIADLAQKLMGGSAGKASPGIGGQQRPPEGLPDMGAEAALMGRIGRLMGELNRGDDKSTALLKAMEPYLSEKRRDKMERAIKLARLARIAGLALEEMGEDNV